MVNAETLEQYRSAADEKLIEQIKLGATDAFAVLMSRYEDFLRFKVEGFNFDKAQNDDYMQEATLSFFNAVKSYNKNKSSFRTYLNVCVSRALISFKRKHKRHNESETQIEADAVSVLDDRIYNPQDMIENQERVDALIEDIQNLLSQFELKALTLYLGGGSYDSIAQNLGTTAKSVDNALQRVRSKLKNRN